MSQYTPDMAENIRKLKKEVPYTLDIMEWDNGFILRCYETEVLKLDFQDRIKVMRHLSDTRHLIKSYGFECEIMGVRGGPPKL